MSKDKKMACPACGGMKTFSRENLLLFGCRDCDAIFYSDGELAFTDPKPGRLAMIRVGDMAKAPDCPFCLKSDGVYAVYAVSEEGGCPAFSCHTCGAWFKDPSSIMEWPRLKTGRAAALRVRR